jgi:hypothetical protein
MSKINRLAVLICGDFRTWKIAAPYLFRFCETFSDNVDYYFATWQDTQEFSFPTNKTELTVKKVTDKDITDPFKGKNLVDYKIMPLPKRHNEFKNTFYYQAYLAKVANILKNKYEFNNNLNYDNVIETRPDMYLGKGVNISKDTYDQLGDFDYVNGPVFQQQSSYPQCADVYYRSSTFCNDIVSNRFFRCGYNFFFYGNSNKLDNFIVTNNHWMLMDYFYTRKLIAKPEFKAEIQAPIPIRFQYANTDFDSLTLDELIDLHQDWCAKYKNGEYSETSEK